MKSDAYLSKIRTTQDEDEEDQTIVQTKYGHIRKSGMMRAIFTMWPTAAKKVRIRKLLNEERKSMNDKKREDEATQLGEDEQRNNTADM